MNKIGRPKTDRKEIAKTLKEIEKNYQSKVITQEFCAEKLGITHRTFCNIIKGSFDFSILDTEQIKESDMSICCIFLHQEKLFLSGQKEALPSTRNFC